MKKYLIALAATTVFAAPALAVTPPNYQTATYGHDAVGVYALNASAQTFCRFGTDNTGSSNTGETVDTTGGGGATEADGTFTFTHLQNPNTDTVQHVSGSYNLNNIVCNTPFTVTATSANGGLKSANTTSDTAFTQLVKYSIQFLFDGLLGSSIHPSTPGTQTLLVGHEARAGSGSLNIYTVASNDLLLEGGYSDTVTLSMTPNV
jgi:hypothetical protein